MRKPFWGTIIIDINGQKLILVAMRKMLQFLILIGLRKRQVRIFTLSKEQ